MIKLSNLLILISLLAVTSCFPVDKNKQPGKQQTAGPYINGRNPAYPMTNEEAMDIKRGKLTGKGIILYNGQMHIDPIW